MKTSIHFLLYYITQALRIRNILSLFYCNNDSRTRLNVTLHLHWLPCFFWGLLPKDNRYSNNPRIDDDLKKNQYATPLISPALLW